MLSDQHRHRHRHRHCHRRRAVESPQHIDTQPCRATERPRRACGAGRACQFDSLNLALYLHGHAAMAEAGNSKALTDRPTNQATDRDYVCAEREPIFRATE